MVKNLDFVTDPYGKFYAGMTKKEAKENGTYKNFWSRDFKNIDTNKDGVLSVKEIMNERRRSSMMNRTLGFFCAGLGIVDVILNRNSKIWLVAELLLDGFLTVSCLANAYKTDKGTKEIEKNLDSMA